jgi:uncharacterized membrane protein HdeD (DUF308 family)
MAIGAVGIFVPADLVWIAQRSESSAAFYVIASIRIAFGVILLSAAPVSRAPRTLWLLGVFVVFAGIMTALTALVGMDRARLLIDWWLQQGSAVVRLTAAVVLALGGFIAYACAPVRLLRTV